MINNARAERAQRRMVQQEEAKPRSVDCAELDQDNPVREDAEFGMKNVAVADQDSDKEDESDKEEDVSEDEDFMYPVQSKANQDLEYAYHNRDINVFRRILNVTSLEDLQLHGIDAADESLMSRICQDRGRTDWIIDLYRKDPSTILWSHRQTKETLFHRAAMVSRDTRKILGSHAAWKGIRIADSEFNLDVLLALCEVDKALCDRLWDRDEEGRFFIDHLMQINGPVRCFAPTVRWRMCHTKAASELKVLDAKYPQLLAFVNNPEAFEQHVGSYRHYLTLFNKFVRAYDDMSDKLHTTDELHTFIDSWLVWVRGEEDLICEQFTSKWT